MMSIHIHDDLGLALKSLAETRRISVEQLAIERLQTLLDQPSSPTVLRRKIGALPPASGAAVDELEAAILAGRLPVQDASLFEG